MIVVVVAAALGEHVFRIRAPDESEIWALHDLQITTVLRCEWVDWLS
jgi:hypothetical protein